MNSSEKPARIPSRLKDILWHGGKTVLCLLQFFLASALAVDSVIALADGYLETVDARPLYRLILLATQLIVFYALWHYYDDNDDRSFDAFCASDETPKLLRDPAYIFGLVLTSLGGAVPLFFYTLYPLFRESIPAMPIPTVLAVASVLALALSTGLSVYRLRRLNYVWSVQKTLRRPTDKRMSLVKRLLYAAVFAVAVQLATVVGIYVIPQIVQLAVSLLVISPTVLFVVLCLVLLLVLFLTTRRVLDRRKFLKRLEALRARGELSYTVHGRPYLSLFFRRAEFGLTVIDEPHPDARVQEVTTYQIAVANCNRRRLTVILCEENIFQFVYSFRLRVVGHVGTLAMGGKILTIPLGSFFVNHSFEFPEGEGKRILLVDPAPANLCMRGFREGELITLDNASEIYGYTVYGKNSFVSMLERS